MPSWRCEGSERNAV